MQFDSSRYLRDMHDCGTSAPNPQWRGGAKIAQLALNYEEDDKNCVLHGDAASVAFHSEVIGARLGGSDAVGAWNL